MIQYFRAGRINSAAANPLRRTKPSLGRCPLTPHPSATVNTTPRQWTSLYGRILHHGGNPPSPIIPPRRESTSERTSDTNNGKISPTSYPTPKTLLHDRKHHSDPAEKSLITITAFWCLVHRTCVVWLAPAWYGSHLRKVGPQVRGRGVSEVVVETLRVVIVFGIWLFDGVGCQN
ncbi:hypothetical protein RND71_035446 [Anisodus tanguticus]|uniref:Uncharacterized protein n=1 Tax=Anisodus tanguticus TaxID=243964 RepID=A0AAE1R4Y2_9SOLA|nr:hypothetical protein RND71_035446 [Anisodus tanguticus]